MIHKRGEAVLVIRGLLHLFVLGAYSFKISQTEHVIDTVLDYGNVSPALNKVHRAQIERAKLCIRIVVRSHDNHGYIADTFIALLLFKELAAVHTRHNHIQQHNVNPLRIGAHYFQRLSPARSR